MSAGSDNAKARRWKSTKETKVLNKHRRQMIVSKVLVPDICNLYVSEEKETIERLKQQREGTQHLAAYEAPCVKYHLLFDHLLI